MNPVALSQIVAVVDGSATGVPERLIETVGHDTRDLTAGMLFVAIKGDTHDGHDHLAAAAAGGAAAAVVRDGTPVVADLLLIHVADTRVAMGKLATMVRASFRGKVIAVAGSNGKTGTKNLISTALTGVLAGSASPKSFNNDIGVPTTIFAANPGDDYLVLELGTNHPGEILNLTNIARPDIAVITSIGEEHLEYLTDLPGVRHENAQLLRGLAAGGLLIATGDDPLLHKTIPPFDGRRIRFGLNDANDVIAEDVVCDATGVRFNLSDTNAAVFVPLMGRHSASNALAAILVARELGIADEASIANLANAAGVSQRLQLRSGNGITVLDDAYNANPHSMRAALLTIAEMRHTGRRLAVLGDMLELGGTAAGYHDEIGRLAAACGLDGLLCVGPLAERIAAAANRAGMQNVQHFSDAAACAAAVVPLLRPGDLVLLKASRGIKLETVVDAILNPLVERNAHP